MEDAQLGVNSSAKGEPVRQVTVVLVELAQDAVTAVAPEQQELLAVATARWEAGGVRRRRRRSMGGSIGSGMDPIVISELIYPLLTGTFAQVLGAGAVAGWQRRRWPRRRPRGVPPAPPVRQVRVTLDADQIDMVRSACISHGETLGLSTSEATLLADALYGSLSRALSEPPEG